MAGKLTALKVKALTKPGRYGDGAGLWLQVRGPDQRSWLFRFTIRGKQQQMGLGSVDVVSLAEAREAANAARKLLHAGVNPLADRRAKEAEKAAESAAMTFRAVCTLYIAAHEPSWRNPKHRAQWHSTLETYVYPVLGDLAVSDVDVGAVMKVIEPIWRTKTETATRVRMRIEAVLDYARARNWRTGENPARWRGHIENLLPKRSKVKTVVHHAALPWREIGAFMDVLAAEPDLAAKALRFTILTAARTSEAIEARWSEIDLDAAVWTVPAERMKAGREHRVPLCAEAVELLRTVRTSVSRAAAGKARKAQSAESADPSQIYVFPGRAAGKPLSNMAMTALLRRLGRGDLTVHGFRSTFRDWAGESTNYPRELAEAALAHTLKDKTEAAYSRGDALEKRRRLMADWATFCGRPAKIDAAVALIRAHG
jgi:integrase